LNKSLLLAFSNQKRKKKEEYKNIKAIKASFIVKQNFFKNEIKLEPTGL